VHEISFWRCFISHRPFRRSHKKWGYPMKKCEKLDEFCKNVLYYVGHGYKYAKIVNVKPSKIEKIRGIDPILDKIQKFYNTGLSRGKRQGLKLKEVANFEAVSYKNLIVILKTSGDDTITKQGEFKEFKKLEFIFSEYLCLILFKDNRDKWTYRLGKETFLTFKSDYQNAFVKGDGKVFHNLQRKWRGFPKYVGIGQQRLLINEFLKNCKKTYKKNWDIRF